MIVSLIAAVGKNKELGKDNSLIWKLPNDLLFFKKMTIYKTVVMGANTYYSIGKPLPSRNNIVITHKSDIKNVKIYHSVEKFLKYYTNLDDEVFVIGGASIYKQFINKADNIYLTEIDCICKDADTFFPDFNKEKYEREVLDRCVEKGVEYSHVLYKKMR